MNASRSPFGSQVVLRTPEIKRIAALPRRVWTEEASERLVDMMTRELKTPGGTMRLRPVQAIALYEAMECGGLFGPMRVGAGKTAVTLLVSLVLEAKRPLLLLPASLIPKTWNDRKALAEHWRLPTNLQVESYESLSLVKSEKKLEYIRPDLLIADEVHFLKGRRAGRTRRFVRYMQTHPDTKFVGVSGTIMKSSVRDFAHLLRFALKSHAPIPVTEDEVDTWADALDEGTNPLSRRQPAAIFDLGARPAGVDTITAARQVFQARLLETRGVVSSSKTDGVLCSIRVQALEYQLSPVMEEHFKTLRTLWETPCGKAFSQATELRMYARELALGFTYTWIPKEKVGEWDALVRGHQSVRQQINVGGKTTQNISSSSRNSEGVTPSGLLQKSTTCESTGTVSRLKSMLQLLKDRAAGAKSAERALPEKMRSTSITTMSLAGSEDFFASIAIERLASSGIVLGLSEPLRTFLEQNRPPPGWLRARREWNSFVRDRISKSKKYDTMLQVANACRAGLLDSETLDAWKEIESSYEPATRPIFYDTIALGTCLTWLKKNVGIVWVEHQAFGAALSQLSGAPYFGPGGLDASGASIANEKGDRSIIASVAACGQGFNLQMFSKNLITSCPSGAATVEQVLGRTHRDGQLADEVTVDVLLGCLEQFEAFERALDGATAAEALLGHSQKLLLADILMPDIDNRKGPLWA